MWSNLHSREIQSLRLGMSTLQNNDLIPPLAISTVLYESAVLDFNIKLLRKPQTFHARILRFCFYLTLNFKSHISEYK